jgi:predicted small secreted protein
MRDIRDMPAAGTGAESASVFFGLAIPISVTALAMVLPLFLGGCNTTRGVGEDVEAAGEGLQDVAEDTKDAIND